jgi:hypothetical protein
MLQPLPHFIIKRSTVLCNLKKISYFVTLSNAISQLPEDGAEEPKDLGGVCNVV